MPLPPPPPTRGPVFTDCFGFGYAASTQEFKVVRFFSDYVSGQPLDRRVTHCQVFTLGTTMWRKARRSAFAPNCPAAPFVNGAVHLLPYIYQPDKAIGAFNLETEEYNYIDLPEYYGELASDDGLESKSLSELGGYLCLTLDFVTKVDLWLLKDYDNGEWTKQYTIDTLQFVDFSSSGIYATRALLILGNGNMLMNLTRQDGITELVCYDPQRHTVTQRIGSDCSATFYVESFFPLQSTRNMLLWS